MAPESWAIIGAPQFMRSCPAMPPSAIIARPWGLLPLPVIVIVPSGFLAVALIIIVPSRLTAVSAIKWLRAIMALSHSIRPWFIRALSPAIMPWPIIAGFARWVVSAIIWDWARAAGAARTTRATVKARIRIRRFQRERVGS